MSRTAVVLRILALAPAALSSNNVCFHGYVMDTYCIELGTLLDNPSKATLLYPQDHSLHCLVDVGVCRSSRFNMLAADPAAGANANLHCAAYNLGAGGTARGRPPAGASDCNSGGTSSGRSQLRRRTRVAWRCCVVGPATPGEIGTELSPGLCYLCCRKTEPG